MCSRLFVLLSVLALLFVPSTSQAWTRAHVREAHARIELQSEGPATVLLELVVDVQGGWLERLELPGLDEDLALSADEPASVTLESGEQLMADASVRSGVVTLKFERRDGLRRGLHHVRIRYTSDLVSRAVMGRGGQLQLAWTLPGWEAGLLGADVSIVAAPGQPLVPVEDTNVAQDIELTSQGDRKALRFGRIHVPRASPWRVVWELPEESLASNQRGQQHVTPRRPWQVGALAALASALLATAARQSVRRRLAKQGLGVRGWLAVRPLPVWLLWLTAAMSALLWRYSLAASVIAALVVQGLAFERVGAPLSPLPLGSFAPLHGTYRSALMRSRWRERIGLPWSDVGSLLGGLGASAPVVFILAMPGSLDVSGEAWGYLALAALPAWLVSARARLPRSLAEQVALLVREAERTRTVSCALSLLWYVAGARREQPRLRLTPSARYPGLLRLEVLVDTRRGATPLVLSVLATSDSAAERWARGLWPAAQVERSTGNSRVAVMMPVRDLSAAVEQLLEHFTLQSERVLGEMSSQATRAA